MNLAPMRYKDYVWPHNPETYTISFKRQVAVAKVPFGRYGMQDLGMSYRVMEGEGVFAGKGAYDEFKKLASVFYQGGPGLLIHPVWQASQAYFVAVRDGGTEAGLCALPLCLLGDEPTRYVAHPRERRKRQRGHGNENGELVLHGQARRHAVGHCEHVWRDADGAFERESADQKSQQDRRGRAGDAAVMKGYLTTCDGAQFELPTLLKWEFSYTGSVPCDSFTLRCAYEPAMAETLRRAVRFTAREDGTVEFAGVVDECGVTCDEKGLQLEVSGRGMAALLLDNEAESVSYQWATMEEILKNHVTPYGIVCTGYDAVTAAARYRVANGSSQWKALNDFAALHGGIAPYFDKTGALEVKKNRKAARVSIDAKTPVTALSYCDKRYGVIAEALVVDSKAGVKQSVKNEAFCARGGTSRRVFYVPARSGTQAMRYTGEYQIAKSKEGAETLRVTIAGRFTAAPGDIAAVSETKVGIVGNFRVIECVRRFGESGEAYEVTMQRE